jgi:hypothetical protein
MKTFLYVFLFLLLSIYTLAIGANIVSIKNSNKSDTDKLEEIKKIGIGMTVAGSVSAAIALIFGFFLLKKQ